MPIDMSRLHHPKKRFNNYEIIYDPSGAYVIVELTQNQWCKVDIDDWERLRENKWYAVWVDSTSSYYVFSSHRVNGIQKTLYIHRMVLDILDPKKMVDHVNHDTLDNRKIIQGRVQLRIASKSENQCNKKMMSVNKTGKIGICKHVDKRPNGDYVYWIAKVVKKQKCFLKRFPFTDVGFLQAIDWRESKKLEIHGEFAYHA